MLKLKKTAVAVLAFGSSAVFAGTMGPVCAPGNVTVPCERSAWEFGAKALYLQPSYSDFGYVGATETRTSTGGIDEHFDSTNNRWGWGFMIEGAYSFNTGNDLNLNWYHWDRTTTKNLPSDGFETSGAGGDVARLAGDVDASLKPRWDAVNLEFGQHVDFGVASFVRFHGGVQYARINTKGSINATGIIDPDGDGHILRDTMDNVSMTYNGFGPRLGADLVYGFGNGLGIYAKAASALLVGPQGFTASHMKPSDLDGDDTRTASGSYNKIVPELESKLGATYTYSMAQGDISLDIGWMWNNYFHAQHVGADAGEVISSDFSLQGPYIGLNWMGNIA